MTFILARWSADYIDPHSNAQGFAWNPDNSDKSAFKMLAWRNAWDIPQLTKETQAALEESSTAKRAQRYEAMQKEVSRELAVRDHVPESLAGRGAAGRDGSGGRADLRPRVVSRREETVSVAAQLTAFQRLQLVLTPPRRRAPDVAFRALAADARRDLRRVARGDVFSSDERFLSIRCLRC